MKVAEGAANVDDDGAPGWLGGVCSREYHLGAKRIAGDDANVAVAEGVDAALRLGARGDEERREEATEKPEWESRKGAHGSTPPSSFDPQGR